jgi:hypothetical protein
MVRGEQAGFRKLETAGVALVAVMLAVVVLVPILWMVA